MSPPTSLDLTEVPRDVRVLCRDDEDSRVEVVDTTAGPMLALSVKSESEAIGRTAFVFGLTPSRALEIAAGLVTWARQESDRMGAAVAAEVEGIVGRRVVEALAEDGGDES